MLRKEEIEFNEAKRRFDEAKNSIEEAIRFYDYAWDFEREESGITPEGYLELEKLQKLVREGMPKRDVIVDRVNFQPSISQSSDDSQTNLMVANERTNIFSRLTNFIRKSFNKLLNRNDDLEQANNSAIEKEEMQPGVTSVELDIDFSRPPTERRFDVSALLQECNEAYQELHRKSEILDQTYERTLSDPPKGKVIEKKHDGPGILDDYRQGSWGIKRICLDGFQNHLPADSKGTKCYLHFLVGNKWVDCETAKLHRDKIKAVRFSDNGVGFTADNLFYLHSTKTSEDNSAGQFGEGMKLASIAAVNLGLGLEFQSRNWVAFAGAEEKKLINTRNDDAEEARKKLVYDVTVYDGEPIRGSRTIFHTPTPEFIDYALQLPELVLELGGKKPIFSLEEEELVETERAGLAFVKGIYVTDLNSFYSYNFKNANVNPDRNGFHQFSEKDAIRNVISSLEDKELIKNFLSKLIDYCKEEKLWENQYYYWGDYPLELAAANRVRERFSPYSRDREKFAELWKTAFEELCMDPNNLDKDGNPKKVILGTDYKIPDYLKDTLDDYIIVRLSQDWTETLNQAGIPTDRDIVPEYIEEKIQTSLTLDYGSQIWGEQRIVLDACQNHLPADCKGSNIFLRFQTVDGLWHDYREFEHFSDAQITKIKISDDGIGYDAKNLELFASVKDHDGSSGKWGEGLKMLAAAAVRGGVQMELRSRDWVAIPETQTEILNEGKENEKRVDRLVFVTKKKVDPKSRVLEDGDNATQSDYGFLKRNEMSSTTFINPTPELIREFRNIRDSVLLFSPRTPIAKVNEADILATTGGQLFVRNILIPGNHQLKYSYHLKDFDIETRDRDVIKRESMQEKITEILENVDDENFISEFLSNAVSYAQESRNGSFLEFETPFKIESGTPIADKWIKMFKQKFGERTSIRAAGDFNFNAFHQAQHMGLDMITLPDFVADALMDLRGQDGQSIISYREALKNAVGNTIPVPEEELTEREKTVVNHLYNYNKILALTGTDKEPIRRIEVYDYPEDYKGDKASGFASKGEVINISRDTLNSGIIEAGHVFFHESDHAITGAQDAEKAFRDYLSNLLSAIAVQIFPLHESIEDNGVAQDVSVSDITKALDLLKQVMTRGQGNDDRKNSEGEEFGDE